MGSPFAPWTTYVPGSTPSIKASDLDDLETYLTAIYAAILSLKKMRIDGVGNQGVTPNALLELLGTSAIGTITPQFSALNGSGKIRTLIDRNGYLIGIGVTQIVEPWLLAPGASGSPWTTALSTGAAIAVQDPTANYNTPFLQITPSSTGTATSYALASTRRLFMANAAMNSVVLEFELGLNAAAAGIASNTSFFVGFDNGTDPLGADTQMSFLCKKYNFANYEYLNDNGGIAAVNTTGIAPSANPNNIPVDRFKIEIQGSASPFGSYQVQMWINEALAPLVQLNLPTAALRMVFGSGNEGGAPAGSPLAYLGPVRCTYNYLLTPPAL